MRLLGGVNILIDLKTRPLRQILESNNIKYAVSVPCTILASYYDFHDSDKLENIIVTREEEGIGIISGLSIANEKAIIMMQNSGLGNCLNSLASLSISYKIGFVILVSLRGDDTFETNPVQNVIGSATRNIIDSLGCKFFEISSISQLENTFREALDLVACYNEPVFILLPRKEMLK